MKTRKTKTHKVTALGAEFKVKQVELRDLPEDAEYRECYKKLYSVTNQNGVVILFLGKDHKNGEKEIVGWYAENSAFHYSYGSTFKETVEMLLNDQDNFI